MVSMPSPQALLMSLAHQLEFLALKSPISNEIKGELLLILIIVSSRSLLKTENSSGVWLGDLYRRVMKHFLLPKRSSQTEHSFKQVISGFQLRVNNFYNIHTHHLFLSLTDDHTALGYNHLTLSSDHH